MHRSCALVVLLAACAAPPPDAMAPDTCLDAPADAVPLSLAAPGAPPAVALAGSASGWVVAWRSEDVPVALSRVTDGLVVPGDADRQPLARDLAATTHVSLSADAGWAAWVDQRGQAVGQRLDASGLPAEPSRDGLVAGSMPPARSAWVASVGGAAWLLSARGEPASTRWTLSELASGGARSLDLPFGVREAVVAQGEAAAVVWIDGEGLLRSWPLRDDGPGSIAQGVPVPADAHGLVAVAGPAGVVAGWVDAAGAHSVRLFPHGGAGPVVHLAPDADALALAWGGADPVAAWRTTAGAVRVAPVDAGPCAPVDPVGPTRDRLGAPALAAFGGEVLVGWTRVDADGAWRLWVRRLSAPGAGPATP